MVPRDERSVRAKYVNDAHKTVALKRRELRRVVYESGYKLGESGRRLPKTLHSDDAELQEVFILGFETGRKRRKEGLGAAPPVKQNGHDGLDDDRAKTLDFLHD